jgi:ABC-type nitrate/sulfonate/bicarbonate transport system substrate-binding protein
MGRLFGLTVIALTLVTALPGVARAAEIVPFRVGIAAPTVNMLPLWTAEQSGLFKAHGLNVEIVNTDGGSRGLAEVGAGKLQAMIVGLSAVIDANGKGGNYRLIASGANTMSFRFFGAMGIDHTQALRGGKVGVSTFGSESDSAATMALKQLGLARADVQLVEAGGTLKRLEELKSGKISATALNEPADTEARRDGLPLLADLKADLPWIFTAVAMDRNYLASHRQQVREFLQAYIEGIYVALSDPVRAKAVLTGEFRDLSREALDATYDDFRARVPRDAEPSGAGAELMLRELPVFGGGKQRQVEDFIDTSVLDELRRSGFFDDLKRRYRVP